VAQTETPVTLDRAYTALRANDLEAARKEFVSFLRDHPAQTAARTDYGYLLLRLGESVAAREEFAVVVAQRPEDEKLALEYAFLAFETGERAKALEVFMRLKLTSKNESIQREAGVTADRLVAVLDTEIARWRRNAELNQGSYSVHEELARLLEERNDFVGAAAAYRVAYGLKTDRRRYLLDIARVEEEALRPEYQFAALLAASRCSDPFVAEAARERLPARYPYVYEFEAAISLDPLNVGLRRELGFLLLEMREEKQARKVFEDLVRMAPEDALALTQLGFLKMASNETKQAKPLLLRAARQSESDLSAVRELAQKSLEKGYLKDALRYYEQVQKAEPTDHATMLRLGWTHNMLHEDREALYWFDLARSSQDPKIAAEAKRAYENLRPGLAWVRTTSWTLPFYSSRWREVFAYGQAKVEFKSPVGFLKPYVSARWIGDLGRASGAPQPLSERTMVFGVGLASRPWKGLLAWGEAGSAKWRPDYRGGVHFSRSLGAAGMGERGGWFGSTTADAVFLSRFDNNTLFSFQNRIGYTVPERAVQVYLNLNLTTDWRRLDWANFVEAGPGVRFRAPGMPTGLYLFADAVAGWHTIHTDRSRSRRFTDLRLGVWYAFTH
jgi:Tfp pilus assembly protein PilF